MPTIDNHLKLIIGELVLTIAALRAELDALKGEKPNVVPNAD